MMSQKAADSVRFEVITGYDGGDPGSAKEANELHLHDRAAEFFGHEDFTTSGYRHDPTEPDGLRTYAIFYDDTPYEVD